MCKQSIKKAVIRIAQSAAVLLIAVWAGVALKADSTQRELSVSASFEGKTITRRELIRFTLSRELAASEGRLAAMIRNTDISSLLVASGNTLTYSPNILPLPEGQTEVSVYLVLPDNVWKPVARFTLAVETSLPPQSGPGETPSVEGQTSGGGQPQDPPAGQAQKRRRGFDKAEVIPSITIGLKSQSFEAHFPDSNRPPRSTFADLTLQGSLRTDLARATFDSQTRFDFVGSSFVREALRFGERGDLAPRIDLSSYLMQFQAGKAKLNVGHIGFGANRHLINSFSSRGLSLTLPLTRRADVSLAAMNGTSIVGWSNFFGLNRVKHQVVSGNFGFEFKPERPGGLRLEATSLDGRLLPLSNFNQGSITDAERSRGMGLRVVASDKGQRFRLDGGLARSRFSNPADPFLNQGRDAVGVREVTRNARYVDVSHTLLQNFGSSETKRATLTVNYRHERVDPLFRSLAAFTQADRNQNQVEMVATIGEVSAAVSHQRFNDNLANISSILKSLSRRTNFILGTPLSSLFSRASQRSAWLPRVSYGFDDMHQFGSGVPVNGGFELSLGSVPDQVSRNQNLSADWQVGKVRFGYRFNRSFQDNRQSGRERADLTNHVNNFNLGWNPTAKLDFGFDLSFESAANRETLRTDRTLRFGTSINWRMIQDATLAAVLSATTTGDTRATSRNSSAEIDVQWAYRFAAEKSRYRKWQTSFFVRYANRYASSRDSVFGFGNLTRAQTLNLGLSFTFF